MAESATNTTIVLAAGGIVLRGEWTSDAVETLVIHRPRHDDWSFPKGKLDPGESFEAAALREVHEETALRCTLHAEITSPELSVVYPVDGGMKQTRYWFMTIERDEGFKPHDEVDECRWVTFEHAATLLTDPLDRALARRAQDELA